MKTTLNAISPAKGTLWTSSFSILSLTFILLIFSVNTLCAQVITIDELKTGPAQNDPFNVALPTSSFLDTEGGPEHTIYPNPSSSQSHMEIESSSQTIQVQFFHPYVGVIDQVNLTPTPNMTWLLTFNVSNLTAGTYWVKVIENGQILSYQLVVQ